MKKVVLLLAVVSIFSVSCKKNQVTCDGSTRTYDADIKSIIDAQCVSCHSNCATYAGLKVWVDNGKFEREVINNRTMPQGSMCSDANLTKIQCWLDQGAPEN